MFIYCIYRHIYSTGPYVHQWYSHTTWDEDVNPLTPTKYTVLTWNFVFDLHYVIWNITLAQQPACTVN
jgi:hypothetical protein